MDELDRYISQIVSKKITEPYKYEYTIKNALKYNKSNMVFAKRNQWIKILATAMGCIVLCTSIVFAKDIIQYIQNIFNNRQGFNTAIQNNYIQKNETEQINCNGTNVKANYILMDDYNLDINFEVQLQNIMNSKDNNTIEFKDFMITDENNRIIYCNNENMFNQYCYNNNLYYKMGEFNENYINSAISSNTKLINYDDKKYEIIYNLSAYNNVYPKSKALYIKVNNLIANNSVEIVGTWEMKIDLPEKFQNREIYVYKADNSNNINVLETIVYNTGTNFTLQVPYEKKEYSQEYIDELLEKAEKEANNYNKDAINTCNENEHSFIGPATEELYYIFNESETLISDVYIQNENGEKYYITNNVNENGTINKISEKGLLEYSNTLDLTIYNATNILNLHFKYKGIDYNIELKRK